MTALLVSAVLFLCLVSVCAVSIGKYELFDYNPVANASAVVVSGNARFTVLTSRMIRMEYSKSGTFEDRATLAFVNRALPVVPFHSFTTGGVLVIETSELMLNYTVGSTFSAETLSVSPQNANSGLESWVYGQLDTGNLLGTIRSLDLVGAVPLNCTENAWMTVHDEQLHCEWGVVSRAGWAVVNDTANQALTAGAEWWAGWNTDTEDLYFFGYGLDFKGALADFTRVAGSIALVPRYATGVWWTRWYDLNNADIREIVEDYEMRTMPLDVFVLDMDWHVKPAWGAYTFDDRLFPFPADSMGYLQHRGLHVAVNIHDDNGVAANEKMHDALATYMGLPASTGLIPFSLVNKTYVYGLQDVVMADVVSQGVDFWWTDWQQGGTEGGCEGGKMNPTIWTNKQRGTEHLRRGEDVRAVHLGRFGGLGSHRYQVGFSGDVLLPTWETLQFQPYFSATASNVAFGYWSHDIVAPNSWDYEQYARWLQWGVHSAVMRSHDRGMSAGVCADIGICAIVRAWNVPTKFFEVNRAALRTRAEMVPYLYTVYRQGFDSGLSPVRPMYYDFPSEDGAYTAALPDGTMAQYMLGDDVMVAPVVSQSNATTSMASKRVWIPPGAWIDVNSYTTYQSDGTLYLQKDYDVTEVPKFVRAGAVIPFRPLELMPTVIGTAAQQYTELGFMIHSGSASGSGSVYEDDGISMGYLSGQFAYTSCEYSVEQGVTNIIISTNGSYSTLPATRTYVVVLAAAMPALSVYANGVAVKYARFGGLNAWTYDGQMTSTIIVIAGVSTSSPLKLTVTAPVVPNQAQLFNGLKGLFAHAILAKRNLDQDRTTPGSNDDVKGDLMAAARVGDMLSYLAGAGNTTAFVEVLANYRTVYNDALGEIESIWPLSATRLHYSVALLESALV